MFIFQVHAVMVWWIRGIAYIDIREIQFLCASNMGVLFIFLKEGRRLENFIADMIINQNQE